MDFLSGSFDGRPYWAESTAAGEYKTPVMLTDKDGKELILGSWWNYEASEWTALDQPHALSVAPVDWDGDGDLDLIQGTSKGGLYLIRNEGSAQKPAFASSGMAIGIEIPSGYSMPIVADWDGDGLWDILSGSDSGAVYLARNRGGATEPRFEKAEVLLEIHQGKRGTGPGTDTQIAVGDLNGDGYLDLIVGDNTAYSDDSHLSEEDRARGEEIRRELSTMNEVIQAYYGQDEAAKAAVDPGDVERLTSLLELQQQFSPKYIQHGYVWMYLRKKPQAP
jgi:hypothetical protein